MDNSLNPSELLLLVDEAIGIPDGIINCVELNRLLKTLAEDVTNGRQELENQRLIQEDRLKALEEALAEVNEAMDQFEDLQPNVQEGAAETRRDDEKSKEVESGLEETEDVAEDQYNDEQMKVVESTPDDKQEVTEKEQVNEVLEESVGENENCPDLEERREMSRQPSSNVESDVLTVVIDEQMEKCRMNEEKLLTVIGVLEERLEKVEELFCQKLDHLTNEFHEFQAKIVHKQTNLEEATSTASIQHITNSTEQMNKIEKFSSQLTELHHQMEQLLSHKDQIPVRLEALLEEKLKTIEFDASGRNTLVKRVDTCAVASKSTSRAKESAATTHEVMENLSCLACDATSVVQRMRNGGRYVTPRTSAKLAIVARRLQESQDLHQLPGQRRERTCGGSYTVVKPNERVFRQVNLKLEGSNPNDPSKPLH